MAKIQLALLLLDAAVIDEAERQAKRYGTSTASAVLAYKTRRNIINYSYQTRADNIVGIMTMTALDKEMLAAELGSRTEKTLCRLEKPDGAPAFQAALRPRGGVPMHVKLRAR